MEGFDGGGVVDGDDCGDACLSEGAKTAAGVALAIGWSEIGGGVVEEDGDLALDIEVGWEACRSRGRRAALR